MSLVDDAELDIRALLGLARAKVPKAPPEFLAALAVNDYIAAHLSAIRYWDLQERREPLPVGGDDADIAERAIGSGAGLCGQASSLAMVLYARLGIRARQLDVLSADAGHTTVEVWYDGWRWFDPLFGYFYRPSDAAPWAVYSLIQALWHSDAATLRVGNDARLAAQVIRCMGNGMRSGLDVKDLGAYRVTFHNGEELYRR